MSAEFKPGRIVREHRASAANCRLNPGVYASGNHCRVCEPEHFAPADATDSQLAKALMPPTPEPEPEWKDGQIGDALVHGASVRGFISNDGESFVFSVPGGGYHEAGYGSFEDFVPLVVIDPERARALVHDHFDDDRSRALLDALLDGAR